MVRAAACGRIHGPEARPESGLPEVRVSEYADQQEFVVDVLLDGFKARAGDQTGE